MGRARRHRTRRLRVRVSYDIDIDLLTVLQFGATLDGQLPDEVEEPAENFYVFRRGPEGPVIGFGVENPYEFELPELERPLMPRYRFDAPTVGIRNGTAEEVLLAGCAVVDGRSTPDVVFFDLAVEAGANDDDEQAETFWRHCLATGELKAHFGLGYTLCDLGRPREAYGHLLEYTRFVPRNPWAWSWLGKVSEEIGEHDQAVRCYRRAIRLEAEGSLFETDARERLDELEPRKRGRRRRGS